MQSSNYRSKHAKVNKDAHFDFDFPEDTHGQLLIWFALLRCHKEPTEHPMEAW